jgi:hypothetical protein
MAENIFQYQALSEVDSIRLLILQPAASFDDEIRCKIVHTSQGSKPTYEALSYVWGDPQIRKPICIQYNFAVSQGDPTKNFQPDDSRYACLQVTTNLDSALRYLRKEDEERIMWIDAICINQIDSTEKNHQVRRMRAIYCSAARVLAWLGEEGTARIALEWIEEIYSANDDEATFLGFINNYHADKTKWLACDELFRQRPFWERLWVVQELLHNRPTLICIGNIRMDIDKFLERSELYFVTEEHRVTQIEAHSASRPTGRALDKLYEFNLCQYFNDGQRPMEIILLARPQYRDNPYFEGLQLLSLLHHCRSLQTSNPKDRIYALLGMARSEFDINIEYSDKLLTVRDLYVHVTRKMMMYNLVPLFLVESSQRDIISGCDDKTLPYDQTLPSWVPDFANSDATIKGRLDLAAYFSAHKNLPNGFLPKDGHLPGEFVLYGAHVATITETRINEANEQVAYRTSAANKPQVAMIRYARIAERASITEQRNSINLTSTWKNTSSGPFKSQIGDLIVVLKSFPVPAALRRYKDKYLYVGLCVLVEQEVDWFKLTDDRGNDLCGFDPIMFGSIGGNGQNVEMQEFVLC